MSEKNASTAKNQSAPSEKPDSTHQRSDFSRGMRLPFDNVLAFQQTIGNQAVRKLFQSGKIQAKLKVGKPNDVYEQEADRVAERVMRMPEHAIQRKSAGAEIPPAVHARVESLKAGGEPLPESARSYFEPRFGRDFSSVRVRTDRQAAEAARSIQAKAFTVGNTIAFGAREYAPESREGLQLIAHELTHVTQEAQGALEIRRAPGPEPTANADSCADLAGWSMENLIREYISLPAESSVHSVSLSALVKERLRSITSAVELQGYLNLILSEGRSDQPGGIELYAFIGRLLSLIEKRETKIGEVGEEAVELRSLLAEEAEKGVSTPEQEKLKRRLAWREDLVLAERPTRQWVLLHRGLIEELRIQYEDLPPSSELEVIANRVHEQQALLAWALKQDMGAIQKRMKDIVDLLGGFGAFVSEADESYGMSPPESSLEYEEPREALKQEYLKLDNELKDEEKELDLLARSFTENRWEAIRATYERFPKDPPPMWCMRALYKGIGAMFSPEASNNIEKGIWEESIAYEKRTGKDSGDYRTVDRMMINLGREGKTGNPVSTHYNRDTKRYAPNLRDMVAGMVRADRPGWYMFGVSLHGGYHSVALAVEVPVSGGINIYWMDQYSRDGFSQKTDASSAHAMDENVYAEWVRPGYGYGRITVWPILPPESLPEPETMDWGSEEESICTSGP